MNLQKLFISSIPNMWSIYMQPKYVTHLSSELYVIAHHLPPPPLSLLHTSLTITQDLQPH